MIDFIKKNYRFALKLFANQVGMTIFGLMVIIATKMLSQKIGNDVIYHCAGVLSILMYVYLIYTAVWEKGSEDKIRIDSGKIKENKLYGLYVSLLANSINLIMGIIIAVCALLQNTAFFASLGNTCIIINSYINGMYLTVINLIKSPYTHLLITLPAIIVSTLSYISGIKGQRYIFPQAKSK